MSPATSDRAALLEALARVEPASYGEDGTAIGGALASSLNRLKVGPWKRRAILLITDGVNNRGPLSPLDAAHIARLLGISIYSVGLGTDSVTRFWVPVEQGRIAEVEARIEIDDETLRRMASETGGVYRRVRNSREMSQVLDELPFGKGEERTVEISILDPRWLRSLATLAVLLLFAEFAMIHLMHSELPG
jgi:Ca-activated chloride channel family protein